MKHVRGCGPIFSTAFSWKQMAGHDMLATETRICS
jgi:hypothetical protein